MHSILHTGMCTRGRHLIIFLLFDSQVYVCGFAIGMFAQQKYFVPIDSLRNYSPRNLMYRVYVRLIPSEINLLLECYVR